VTQLCDECDPNARLNVNSWRLLKLNRLEEMKITATILSTNSRTTEKRWSQPTENCGRCQHIKPPHRAVLMKRSLEKSGGNIHE
jgi:hypothetical protein